MFSFYPFLVCFALLLSLTVIYVKMQEHAIDALKDLEEFLEIKNEYHTLMDLFIWEASHGRIVGNVSLNGKNYWRMEKVFDGDGFNELVQVQPAKWVVKNRGFRGNGFISIKLCGKKVCVVIEDGFTFRPVSA